ncbi:tyrosine-type recombinase/integrase [Haloparvum sp. PAK95]|uniref:tyrosine-type recombinase/integrase n=1 Tax=Haloparvum sp. PAK95 TaxID=3418962 RepID=UPI003D2EA46E
MMELDHEELLNAYANHIEGTNLSESTVTRYRTNTRQYLEWVEELSNETSEVDGVFDVNPETLETHLKQMVKDGYAPQSIKLRRASVKSFYEVCQKLVNDQTVSVLADLDDGVIEGIDDDPIEQLDTSQIDLNSSKRENEVGDEAPPHITPEEKEKLVENVPQPRTRNALMIRLLWQTGLRAHEACNIELEDVDRRERKITVRSQKTESTRNVWYQSSIENLMDLWIEVKRPGFRNAEDSSYLFVTERSDKIMPDGLNKMVRKAADKAGIQDSEYTDQMGRTKHKVHAHVLRHSFAVQALRNGWNLEYIRQAMGHEELDTTRVFLDALDADLRKAFTEMGPGTEKRSKLKHD